MLPVKVIGSCRAKAPIVRAGAGVSKSAENLGIAIEFSGERRRRMAMSNLSNYNVLTRVGAETMIYVIDGIPQSHYLNLVHLHHWYHRTDKN